MGIFYISGLISDVRKQIISFKINSIIPVDVLIFFFVICIKYFVPMGLYFFLDAFF